MIQAEAELANEELVAATPVENAELVANGHIKNAVIATMAAGLVPVPLVDLAAITGVNIQMMRSLSTTYGVPFDKKLARDVILGMAGGLAPVWLGASFTSMLKTVPGLGTLAGTSGTVLLGGATTYAIGRLYAEHLENGGDLVSLRGKDVTDRFKKLLAEGKTYAASVMPKKAAKTAEAETAETVTEEAPSAESNSVADAAAKIKNVGDTTKTANKKTPTK